MFRAVGGQGRIPEWTGSADRSVGDSRALIGHAHLKVADLKRAIGLDREGFGFELTRRSGERAAFVSSGSY